MGSVPSKAWRKLRRKRGNRIVHTIEDSEELIGPKMLPWLAKFAKNGSEAPKRTTVSAKLRMDPFSRQPSVLRGESWTKSAELHRKFDGVSEIFEAARIIEDVDSLALTPALEELDMFGSIQPHHPSGLRQQWAQKMQELGWVSYWQSLWIFFWSKNFLKEKLRKYATRRLNFALAVRIMWNATETSESLAQEVISSGAMAQIIEQIDGIKLEETRAVERYFVSGFLSIICNSLRHGVASGREAFLRAEGYEILSAQIKSKFTNLRLKSIIALTYAASEEQPHVLLSIGGSIDELLSVLEKTLNSENHRYRSFYSINLLECLTKFAAIADSNKLMLVQRGGLRIFVRAMKEGLTEEEVSTAARGVWVLSLVNENRSRIRKEPECIDILQQLKFHRNISIADAAKGTLWLVSLAFTKFFRQMNPFTSDQPEKSPTNLWPMVRDVPTRKRSVDVGTSTSRGGHIMISYSWDYKEIAHEVNRELKDAGLATWIDQDFMSGSILESMASAIENASLVTVFLSESYKQSPSCRTEAEYAFRLRKPILPIRNEAGFVADGWCGALVGNQLYFDCFSVEQVRETAPKILKEIGQKVSTIVVDPGCQESDQEKLDTKADIGTEPTDHFLKWSTSEVQEWMTSSTGLSHETAEKFCELTGKNLKTLKDMYSKAPSVYYSTLLDKYHLSLAEVLNLSGSLDLL